MGKAEASATLTVHGKTEPFSLRPDVSSTGPWAAVLNSFPLWVIVQLDSNAI